MATASLGVEENLTDYLPRSLLLELNDSPESNRNGTNFKSFTVTTRNTFGGLICTKHGTPYLRSRCRECHAPICRECFIWGHFCLGFFRLNTSIQIQKDWPVQENNERIENINKYLKLLKNKEKAFQERVVKIQNEVDTFTNEIISAVESRTKELLSQIRKAQEKTLSSLKKVEDTLDDMKQTSIMRNSSWSSQTEVTDPQKVYSTIQEEWIQFERPSISLYHNIRSMGLIKLTPSSKINGIDIHDSPFSMEVKEPRDFRSIGTPTLILGSEGNAEGQFLRPWGIEANKNHIIVSDRTNHRIQVFDTNGHFLFKFGSQGSGDGEFERPAGITVNKLGDILVVDKDNHRIQVFTSEGNFKFKFGEQGEKEGQFDYPWDIATNDKCHILVTDTKNYRIQLFEEDGTFMKKFHFDNSRRVKGACVLPRGVCFMKNGDILVTDFNNHKLIIMDGTFKILNVVGGEGSRPRKFVRPQGVAVDDDGNIAVADSRNNRIQIFDSKFNFLWQFGIEGKAEGEFDRPQDVCFTEDSKILVVDYNHRFQAF